MTDIYDQHKAAFANVSAYVICKGGERVATIAFKFPRDGAGRLYAYVHWRGAPMVRGFAGGYGYDKRSAAIANAMRKQIWPPGSSGPGGSEFQAAALHAFREALSDDSGSGWDRRLLTAGFTVWQAV